MVCNNVEQVEAKASAGQQGRQAEQQQQAQHFQQWEVSSHKYKLRGEKMQDYLLSFLKTCKKRVVNNLAQLHTKFINFVCRSVLHCTSLTTRRSGAGPVTARRGTRPTRRTS